MLISSRAGAHGMDDNEVRRYQAALDYATRMHQGQKRIGGADYIKHPVAVSQKLRNQGKPVCYQITGLFHDLLEDTTAPEEEIAALSSSEVLHCVKLLTKEPDYDMGAVCCTHRRQSNGEGCEGRRSYPQP